jgi:hypothetical protein
MTPQQTSDTPRIDAQMESPNERTVPIEVARQLERETNQMRAALRMCRYIFGSPEFTYNQQGAFYALRDALKATDEAIALYDAPLPDASKPSADKSPETRRLLPIEWEQEIGYSIIDPIREDIDAAEPMTIQKFMYHASSCTLTKLPPNPQA